jgi:ParB-like nuclease domain
MRVPELHSVIRHPDFCVGCGFYRATNDQHRDDCTASNTFAGTGPAQEGRIMATDPRAQAIDALLNSLREANRLHSADTIKWRSAVGEALSRFKKTSGYQRMPQTLITALYTEFKISKDEADKLRDRFDRGAAESDMATTSEAPPKEEAESTSETDTGLGPQPEPAAEAEQTSSTEAADAKPYQVMPPLAPEDYAALEESIRTEGVHDPITVDENGTIIDGYNRAEIASRLGVDCPRRVVKTGLSDAEKRAYAYTVNVTRRHLTGEQKRELVAQSLEAEPELSDREHARRAGVDHKTAGSVREELEGRGEIPHVEKRSDTKGRTQPASKPRTARRPRTPPRTYPKLLDSIESETDDDITELDADTDGDTEAESVSESPEHEGSEADEINVEETDTVEPELVIETVRQPIQRESATHLSPEAAVGMHLKMSNTGARGAITALKGCGDPAAINAFSKDTADIRVLLDDFDHDAELALAELKSGEASA